MDTLRQGPIGRATVRTSAVLALKLLAQAVSLILLAYLLGPSLFGTYAALASLAALFGGVATFGTHVTLLRDLTRSPESRDSSLSRAIGTTCFCGSILLAVYLAVALLLFQRLPASATVIACLGLSEILVQPLLLLSTAQRHANGRIALSQLFLTLPVLMRMLLLAALWAADVANPLPLYVAGHLIVVVLSTTISVLTLEARWPKPSAWRLVDHTEWRTTAGFALVTTTAQGPAEADKILAAKMLQLGDAGLYTAAARVVGASVIPVLSLMVSALPRLFHRSDRERPRLMKWIFGASFLYGTAASLLLFTLAPAIGSLFGPAFDGLKGNVELFALAVLPLCLRVAATNILMTQAGPWTRIWTELTGLFMLMLLAVLLTPVWATTGLILAVTLAESLMAVIAWCQILSARNSAQRNGESPTCGE